jgi:hypothetical protein
VGGPDRDQVGKELLKKSPETSLADSGGVGSVKKRVQRAKPFGGSSGGVPRSLYNLSLLRGIIKVVLINS